MNINTKPRFNTNLLEKPEPDYEPHYAVILWNDDTHEQVEVVRILIAIMKWSANQATDKMMEAHTKGRTLLIVTHQERAELIAEQLMSFSLTATIEKQ